MPSWPTGIETIKALIASGDLQKVAPSVEAAHGFLIKASGHLENAQVVADTDPTGAYALPYDADGRAVTVVLPVFIN